MITPEIHNDLYIIGLIWLGATLAVCVAMFLGVMVLPWLKSKFKRLILHIQIIAGAGCVWFIKTKHRMKVRGDIRRYERTRTYGRKIVRDKQNTYKRRLVLSWWLCFLAGVTLGAVAMHTIIGF